MRTTIEFPDSLFHRAKLAAVERRITLRELITEALERALDGGSQAVRRMVEPPVVMAIASRVPALTNAEIATLLQAEDVLKAGA
ncbi:MAG: hypothetical protein ACKV19_01495 [Verrucomicrobiales bacterium]